MWRRNINTNRFKNQVYSEKQTDIRWAPRTLTRAINNVLLKALSDQVCITYQCFCFSKLFIFIGGVSAKFTCAFIVFIKSNEETYRNKCRL